jgi:hypothetical protein
MPKLRHQADDHFSAKPAYGSNAQLCPALRFNIERLATV